LCAAPFFGAKGPFLTAEVVFWIVSHEIVKAERRLVADETAAKSELFWRMVEVCLAPGQNV
jgi:hypothetical protein